MLFVQRIVTEWSKESRGGKRAALRNAVPEVINLPAIDTAASGLFLHTATFNESVAFVPREKFERSAIGVNHQVGAAMIYPKFDSIDVRFVWEWWTVGVPERKSRFAFTLAPGQTGRLLYNGRFAEMYEGNWWYRKEVINIAFGDSPNRRIFRRTSPDFVVSEMATLR